MAIRRARSMPAPIRARQLQLQAAFSQRERGSSTALIAGEVKELSQSGRESTCCTHSYSTQKVSPPLPSLLPRYPYAPANERRRRGRRFSHSCGIRHARPSAPRYWATSHAAAHTRCCGRLPSPTRRLETQLLDMPRLAPARAHGRPGLAHRLQRVTRDRRTAGQHTVPLDELTSRSFGGSKGSQ